MSHERLFMEEKQIQFLETNYALGPIKKLNIFLDLFDLKIHFQNTKRGMIVNSHGSQKKCGEVKIVDMKKMKTEFSCSEGIVTSECDLDSLNNVDPYFPFQLECGNHKLIKGELDYTILPYPSHPYQLEGIKVESLEKEKVLRNLQVFTNGKYLSYHNFIKSEQAYFGLLPTRGTSFFSLQETSKGDRYIQICSDHENCQMKQCLVRSSDSDSLVSKDYLLRELNPYDSIWKQLEYLLRMVYPGFYRNIDHEINSYGKDEKNFVKNAIATIALHTMDEEMRKCCFGENFIKKR